MKTIKVKGMSCAHCVEVTRKALEALGLKNVTVDLENNSVSFTEDKNITEETIANAVADAGFELE